jgi:hypothetical protein
MKILYKLSINLGARDLFFHTDVYNFLKVRIKSENNVVLVYRSDIGPKNGLKILTVVINCVGYD